MPQHTVSCLGPLGLGGGCKCVLLDLQLRLDLVPQGSVVLLAHLLLADDAVVVSSQQVEGPPLQALSNPGGVRREAVLTADIHDKGEIATGAHHCCRATAATRIDLAVSEC